MADDGFLMGENQIELFKIMYQGCVEQGKPGIFFLDAQQLHHQSFLAVSHPQSTAIPVPTIIETLSTADTYSIQALPLNLSCLS